MKRIVVLGGSGFLGTALCAQLQVHPQWADVEVVVPTRHPEKARHLLIYPNVIVQEASVHDDQALRSLMHEVDAVINLIAILHGSPSAFEQVHVSLPRRLVAACQGAQIRRVIHVSALGVSDGAGVAPSHYLRTKTEGEQVWRQSGLDVTLLRPSVMFGEQDRFLNLFARLQAFLPMVVLAGADARFQPVWVDDVARALLQCVIDPCTVGQIYECTGPTAYSLAELVKLAGLWSGHRRPVISVPMAVGRLQAAVMACLPGEPLMSADNLDSMKVPNVATGAHPGLAALGITPTDLESVAPAYLSHGASWSGQLDAWRMRARR